MFRHYTLLFVSQLKFFRWIVEILRKAYGTPLEDSDLRYSPIRHTSKSLGSLIDENWKAELLIDPKCKNRPLLWATLKSFQFIIILCALVRVFDTCLLLTLERVFLGKILQGLVKEKQHLGLGDTNETENKQFQLAAVGFTILSLSRLILGSIYYYVLEGLSRKIKLGLTSLVHSKVLRLSQKSLKDIGAGGLINLVSNDGAKLENSYEILTVFIGPLQLCSLTWIVWTHFGVSAISGLLVIVILGLGQSYMGKIGSKFRQKVAIASSRRVKLMTQIVTAIRTIKMYAWEEPFSRLVGKARRKELGLIRRSHVLRTIGWCMYCCTSTLSMFSTIIVYLVTGNALTAEKVFVCTTIYQNIGMVLNIDYPKGLAQLGIFLLTISRFQDFLMLEEVQVDRSLGRFGGKGFVKKQNKKISFQNISVDLNKCFILSNINLELRSSELVVIVGSVGSGKSTFFNTILQEFPVANGKFEISGRVAYSAQQVWLFGGTIRENILFGSPFESVRYEKVIQACALVHDLNSFPQGDETLVAEGGVSLSGGQKARVSLARAVYSEAEIYLLDDTLSAVDQKVGQHILNFCINGLLKDKLRLLITHQLHFLPESTRTLRIENGKISPTTIAAQTTSEHRRHTTSCDDDKDEYEALKIYNNKYFDGLNGNTVEVLTVDKDRVSLSIYRQYFCAGDMSYRYLIAFLIFTFIAQVTQAGESYFLKFSATSGGDFGGWSYGVQVTSLLTVIFLVVITAAQHSSSFLKIIHYNGSTIYNRMFDAVLHAPIHFFTDNCAGHVIERFARDTFMLDEVFPFTIFYASHILQKYILSLLLFVASSFNLGMILPSICLLCAVYAIQQLQLRSCRSLNRLEVSARDPITSHLNSTFHGLTTIRAFRKEDEMESRFRRFVDSYFVINSTKLAVISLTSTTIDFISLTFVNIFILYTICSSGSGSNLGYGIGPLIALTHAIGWATSQFHIIETQAKSVESILKFLQINPECPLTKSENEIRDGGASSSSTPTDWPWKGKIIFENVSLRYSSGQTVLKNISFTIMPGEKIGIIGRTGAGKSSLASALFRLPEPTGEIWIDGINICNIPLKDVRPRISIIPQDPVLFEGTVRTNLDPFAQFSDEALLESLENVNLAHFTTATNQGLDMEIQDGGKNLSVGQRQLICMARALLRKNKILILDEATANIDLETSLLIHEKIREVFTDCTVLTIQHRLTGILDYDRILIMNEGEIMEFDKPEFLLRDPNSYLSQRILLTQKQLLND